MTAPRALLLRVLVTLFALGTLSPAGAAQGELTLQLAQPFTHHMVLQRDRPIRLWGTAPAGADLVVQLGEERALSRADDDGAWEVALGARVATHEPLTLKVEAHTGRTKETLALRDVLIGDVWMCSGQSNMRWRVNQSSEAADVLEQAQIRGLRLMDLEGTLYPDATRYGLEFLEDLTPQNYYTTEGWCRADARSAASFSAVAFAFGRRLARELDVPIGLVHSAVGGAPMEAFIPGERPGWMTSDTYPAWCRERVRQNLAAWFESPRGAQPRHPFEPGFLFDAGLAPWGRFPVRGVVWYQGESNATDTASSGARDAAMNEAVFRELIDSFRVNWSDPELPFVFAQLPGIRRDWELFREVQDRVAQTTDACELAVTIDLGEPFDVHPGRKVPVGERLAERALALAYGRRDIRAAPRYLEHSVDGATAVVRVSGDAPLRTRKNRLARGFQLAGSDRIFHPATARPSGAEILLRAPGVDHPVAVRYGFEDNPYADVVGASDLPLIPFRTDQWADARRVTAAARESFEGGDTGPLLELRGALGTWRAAPEHAEITPRFAHDGVRSLHVLGGEDRTVELELEGPAPASMGMRAERWTRREPFMFRVEALVDGAWSEAFDGDDVRVGARFLSDVTVAVPEGATRLRLRCTSPEGGGLLVDAVTASPRADMAVRSCVRVPWQAPLLRGRDSVTDRVRLEVLGNREPLRVVACRTRVPEQAQPHIAEVKALGAASPPAASLTLPMDHPLKPGTNEIDLVVRWREGAPWTAAVGLELESIELSDGSRWSPGGRPGLDGHERVQRLATVVRGAGDDDVHTTRIPGLVTTKAGTLIAVYDNRYRSAGDLPGDIDVGMSRSTDGGLSWEPMRVIMDMGDDAAWRHDGVGDPAILVDEETGRLWVAATWSHGDRSWNGSGPGLSPEQTGQLMLAHSDDDGLTWSAPINITEQIKDPRWRFVLQGPGRGITMNDGTLVFAAQYRSAPDGPHGGRPFSTILWSKDHGETWRLGTGVKVDTTEAQIVELDDGVLMINCRDNRGGARSIYTTRDLGATWQIHSSSRSALVEPVCMASLLRVDHAALGRLLIFSNPATTGGRSHMTLKVSADDGASWPATMWTLHDQQRGFGYSCLTRIDEEHVGLLYEGVRELCFARFPIAELMR